MNSTGSVFLISTNSVVIFPSEGAAGGMVLYDLNLGALNATHPTDGSSHPFRGG